MEEQPCAHCTSPRLVQARRSAVAVVSRCPHCQRLFAHPLSVVVLDAEDARLEQTVSSLRAHGIRVVAATRIANLERWPVGEVVVTDAAHATRWWSDVGATHMIVLADTDEERSLAERSGAWRCWRVATPRRSCRFFAQWQNYRVSLTRRSRAGLDRPRPVRLLPLFRLHLAPGEPEDTRPAKLLQP
jgi:hypothetical protein